MAIEKQIICNQCYEINVDISLEWLAMLNNIKLDVRNYETLTAKRKLSIPRYLYNLSKEYLKVKRNLATNIWNSDKHPESSSKKLDWGLHSLWKIILKRPLQTLKVTSSLPISSSHQRDNKNIKIVRNHSDLFPWSLELCNAHDVDIDEIENQKPYL